MNKTITLNLRACDFKNTDFCDIGNCAIAKAAKRQFEFPYVSEGVTSITVGLDEYTSAWFPHTQYQQAAFLLDKKIAKSLKYGDDVVRRIRIVVSK